ncbi:MAG: hydrogenase maturation protease [Thiohalomonadaceae bacterium]
MKALVLGVGSPFGADRLGWLAVEALAPHLGDIADLQATDRPGARLLALMRGRQCVVIIDALWGVAPGSVHFLRREQLAASSLPAVHGFGVADALALADALSELPPRVVLVGIGAGQDDTPPAVDWDSVAEGIRGALATENLADSDYS